MPAQAKAPNQVMLAPTVPGDRRSYPVPPSTSVQAPAGLNPIGRILVPMKLDPYFMKSLKLNIKMTVTASGAAGATVTDEQVQYGLIQSAIMHKSDMPRGESGVQFQDASGATLDLIQRLLAGNRNGEPNNGDTLVTSAAAGTTNVELNYRIPFYCPWLHPRDLNLITGYLDPQNTFYLELNLGGVTSFLSGDNAATITALSVTPEAEVYDFSSFQWGAQQLPGGYNGGSIIRPRYEINENLYVSQGISSGAGQQIEIVKTHSLAGFLLFDLAADQITPNYAPNNNIIGAGVQFNTSNFPFGQSRTLKDWQRDGNEITGSNQFDSASVYGNVLPIIFTDRGAYSQLQHTTVNEKVAVDKIYLNVLTAAAGKMIKLVTFKENIWPGLGLNQKIAKAA